MLRLWQLICKLTRNYVASHRFHLLLCLLRVLLLHSFYLLIQLSYKIFKLNTEIQNVHKTKQNYNAKTNASSNNTYCSHFSNATLNSRTGGYSGIKADEFDWYLLFNDSIKHFVYTAPSVLLFPSLGTTAKSTGLSAILVHQASRNLKHIYIYKKLQ